MNEKEYVELSNKWRIRKTTIPMRNITSVFRFMDQVYIDEFFKTGRLKLSSFASNRKLEGDIRQDDNEGIHTYQLISRDRKKSTELICEDMDSERMFCTTSELSLNSHLNRFEVDGCFEIINTLGFGLEIAKVLKGFTYGQESYVNYHNYSFTPIFLEQYPSLPDLEENSEMLDVFKYIDFIPQKYMGQYFQKKSCYAEEFEYRFIWQCEPKHELFISCPEAIKYCKKIT